MASKSNFFVFVFLILVCFTASASVDVLHRSKIVLNYPTIFVDPSGNGNFSTIQAAINHVPVNNQNWIRIYVKAGNYKAIRILSLGNPNSSVWCFSAVHVVIKAEKHQDGIELRFPKPRILTAADEQVNIPMAKPHIYIQGEGKWRTRVNWDGFGDIQTCATFISTADNIFIKSISFTNTYNYPAWKNTIKPALAAMISGDKSGFYRVGFVGLQDTLWDVQGRHYFSKCTIQGAVDFIFGSGQSIYSKCVISVVAGSGLPQGLPGFITAQGRSDPSETNGFIFKDCSVVGNGKTFLGRPWREYARVIFFNSNFSDVIVPQGWDVWMTQGHEHQLTFAEHGCYGIGANTSQRVQWEYKMDEHMIKQFSRISFVDDEGWIKSLPLQLAI